MIATPVLCKMVFFFFFLVIIIIIIFLTVFRTMFFPQQQLFMPLFIKCHSPNEQETSLWLLENLFRLQGGSGGGCSTQLAGESALLYWGAWGQLSFWVEDGSGPWCMWYVVGAADGEGKRVSGTSQAYHPPNPPSHLSGTEWLGCEWNNKSASVQ